MDRMPYRSTVEIPVITIYANAFVKIGATPSVAGVYVHIVPRWNTYKYTNALVKKDCHPSEVRPDR